MKTPDLELKMKLLTELEGGRKTPIFDGYRGQFYSYDHDWDANYEILGKSKAFPGEEVKLHMQTSSREIHYGKYEIGTNVKIREGYRTIAKGIVSQVINPKFEYWNLSTFQETIGKNLNPYDGDNISGFKIDLEHYLYNDKLFEEIDISESTNMKNLLIIKMKKKERRVFPIYKFICKQWRENLKLGNDKIRIDYDLFDDKINLKQMNFHFVTWNSLYVKGQIIVE